MNQLKRQNGYLKYTFSFLLMLIFSLEAAVDLVTLPKREKTQLTIYNSEDITMVREQRLLTVKKGINRIQFSWANTLIDPTSIDFRILNNAGMVDLVDTTFPQGRNDALQWNIESEINGKIAVEIRYFTSGISWEADYVGIANQKEDELGLKGYVRIKNNSGEEYENAETRLVVGTINLVEKIAALAKMPAPERKGYKCYPVVVKKMIQNEMSEKILMLDELSAVSSSVTFSADANSVVPPKVVKKGLSEYFIFTIEGREDVVNGRPVRLISMDVMDVPLETVFKMSERKNRDIFNRYYRFKNKKLLNGNGEEKDLESLNNLGVSPLPNGKVRLFSEYDNSDLSYRGATSNKYIAIGDRFEVDLGRDKDISVSKKLIDQKKVNFKVRQYKRRLNKEWVRYFDLADYDEIFTYEETLVSGKENIAKVELERAFGSSVLLWHDENKPKGWDSNKIGTYIDMRSLNTKIEKVDANYIKYYLDLKPGMKTVLRYTVTVKHRKTGSELNPQRIREPQ